MSFSRILYDSNEYESTIKGSVNQGEYRLLKEFVENNNICFQPNGVVETNINPTSVENTNIKFINIIENESILSNRSNNKKNTLINPEKRNKCNTIYNEDSRFTHPLNNYREIESTKYSYTPFLYNNPQEHISPNTLRSGLSSRLYSKDTFNKKV